MTKDRTKEIIKKLEKIITKTKEEDKEILIRIIKLILKEKIGNKEVERLVNKIEGGKKENAVLIINKATNAKIKIEDIEKYKSSFINKLFQNREADTVYKMKDKNIFFLIEHQTKIDYSMTFRILEYQVNWKKYKHRGNNRNTRKSNRKNKRRRQRNFNKNNKNRLKRKISGQRSRKISK